MQQPEQQPEQRHQQAAHFQVDHQVTHGRVASPLDEHYPASCESQKQAAGSSLGDDCSYNLQTSSINRARSDSCGSGTLEFRNVSFWLPPAAPGWREWCAELTRYRDNPCLQPPQGQQQHGSLPLSQHQPPQQSGLLGGTGRLAQRLGKPLLVDVSGTAYPGRLLAVMGPSGAGKTTLLSVLAGERDMLSPSSGSLSGEVLLGGQPRRLGTFRRITAHVKQDDVLLPTTTPREALAFAAALRLPGPTYSRQQRAAAVSELLEGMRLDKCGDTVVGDVRSGIKGLSGGERRRLAVAVELLGAPSLALLDEPSTGQDSSTAVAVSSFIKQLITCGSQRTAPGVLVMTLHQPGRELTSLIDDLLLLSPGGRAVYTGPWDRALCYFEAHLALTPPPLTGLAEWYLSLIDSSSSSSSSSSIANSRALGLADAWQGYLKDRAVGRQTGGGTQHHWHQQPMQAVGIFTPKQQPHQNAKELMLQVVVDAHRTIDNSEGSVEAGVGVGQSQVVCGPHAVSASSAEATMEHMASVCQGSSSDMQCAPEAATPPDSKKLWRQQRRQRQQRQQQMRYELHGEDSEKESSARGLFQQAQLPGRGHGRCVASFWVQVHVLAVRSLMWWWRNPAMVLSEAVQYLFVVLFLGSCYPRLPSEGQAAAVDRLAALFMWVTALLVTAPSRALLSWDMERRLLRHELATGAYSLPPFLVGTKILISLPLETLLVTASGSLLYFMLGLQLSGAKFGMFMALSVLCALCANNVGHLAGLLVPDLNLALPALCVGATLLLAFAGFIVQAVPGWWSWMGDVSFCTYAYAGLVRNEFEGLNLTLSLSPQQTAAVSAGGAAANTLAAATQAALQTAMAALQGGSPNVANTSTLAMPGWQMAGGAVHVAGLAVVPSTIRVQLASVEGFVGIMAAFAAGSSVLVLGVTALLVKLRYR